MYRLGESAIPTACALNDTLGRNWAISQLGEMDNELLKRLFQA